MIYILAFILAIGILVTIHEFGHFLMAKLLKIKVRTFSIGFGPSLFEKKIGETTYKISLIPLGGYVRFENEKEFFQKEPWYKKALVVIAGPLANILFTYFSFVMLFYFFYKIPKVENNKVIFYTLNTSSPLMKYNNKVVLNINNISVKSYKDLKKIKNANKYVITLENNTKLKLLSLKNIYPYLPPIGYVIENGTLAKFGLKGKIKVYKVNNYSINSWYDLNFYKKLAFSHLKNKTVNIKIKIYSFEKNKNITLTIPLRTNQKFGLEYNFEYERKKISFFEANVLALKALKKYSFEIFKFLENIFSSPSTLEKNIGGPISIAHISGTALKNGPESFLFFLALLSLQLGILNLLPIPMLDGGHLFTFLIEAIIRRPIPEKVRYELQFWGFIILMFLTFLALKADVKRFLIK